jgi:class 3 adenylate cyclase
MSGAPLPVGTVTFLFSDIEGSSDLVRSVGNSVFAAVRGDHRRLLRESFAAHGGHEIDTAGDGFFVAFDSARNAVAAAASAQASLAAFSWPTDAEVRVRMGLHTAEPHLSGEGYVGIGVHRAARICEAARGGQILASNATAGIIEDAELPGIELVDLGTHRLKGLPYAQRLFQVTVEGLPSSFDRPRTGESRPPGAGTFLLTDLMGFRHLIRTLGDERSTSLAAEYLALVSGLVEDEGGIVLERAGDSVVGVFADAGNAIRAAAAIRGAVADFTWPPGCDVRVSIAIHSGRWSGDPDRVAAPTTLRRLGLLAAMLEPEQVLVSQATASLVAGDPSASQLRDLGERSISDEDEPERVYELSEQEEARA